MTVQATTPREEIDALQQQQPTPRVAVRRQRSQSVLIFPHPKRDDARIFPYEMTREVVSGDAPIIRYVGTDMSEDRYGSVIDPNGANIEPYMQSGAGMFCFAHNYDLPPIGKTIALEKKGKKLIFTVQFATDIYDGAAILYRLVKEGYMPGSSIGFLPLEFEDFEASTVHPWFAENRKYTKWELLELSAVPVPANRNALKLAVSRGVVSENELKMVFGLDEFMRGEFLYLTTRSGAPHKREPAPVVPAAAAAPETETRQAYTSEVAKLKATIDALVTLYEGIDTPDDDDTAIIEEALSDAQDAIDDGIETLNAEEADDANETASAPLAAAPPVIAVCATCSKPLAECKGTETDCTPVCYCEGADHLHKAHVARAEDASIEIFSWKAREGNGLTVRLTRAKTCADDACAHAESVHIGCKTCSCSAYMPTKSVDPLTCSGCSHAESSHVRCMKEGCGCEKYSTDYVESAQALARKGAKLSKQNKNTLDKLHTDYGTAHTMAMECHQRLRDFIDTVNVSADDQPDADEAKKEAEKPKPVAAPPLANAAPNEENRLQVSPGVVEQIVHGLKASSGDAGATRDTIDGTSNTTTESAEVVAEKSRVRSRFEVIMNTK